MIEGVKNGSYLAFRRLYESYAGLLYGFVLEQTHSRQLAEEVVQDAFVKVWINRARLDPHKSFKAYLFQIAKNRLTDEFRRKLKEPLFEDYLFYVDDESMSSDSSDRTCLYDEFITQYELAKSRLSPRRRQILELNKEEGMTAVQIAALLHISEQVVYNQLSLSIKILREEMSKAGFVKRASE